jgi:hypothetical protein
MRTTVLAMLLATLPMAACDVGGGEPSPTASRTTPAETRVPAGAETGLAAARAATARFHRLDAALAAGYVDIDVYMPGMGHHYLNPTLLDSVFDPANPELLVFADAPGGRRLVAVEYAVPLALSAAAPAGFHGDADVWDRNETFGLWTLHAWVWLDNPDGVFAAHNPRLH